MKSDTREQHVSVQQGFISSCRCTRPHSPLFETQTLVLKEISDSLVLECVTKSTRETQTLSFCCLILHRLSEHKAPDIFSKWKYWSERHLQEMLMKGIPFSLMSNTADILLLTPPDRSHPLGHKHRTLAVAPFPVSLTVVVTGGWIGRVGLCELLLSRLTCCPRSCCVSKQRVRMLSRWHQPG